MTNQSELRGDHRVRSQMHIEAMCARWKATQASFTKVEFVTTDAAATTSTTDDTQDLVQQGWYVWQVLGDPRDNISRDIGACELRWSSKTYFESKECQPCWIDSWSHSGCVGRNSTDLSVCGQKLRIILT